MSKSVPSSVTKTVSRHVNKSAKKSKILKVIVIGLGAQAQKDHIPAILRRKNLKIVALVDNDEKMLSACNEVIGTKAFQDVREAVRETQPDLAIVSVPHNQYFEILEILALNHIGTLKEKPFAVTYAEASEIINLYNTHDTYLQICVQRRYSKLYETTKKLLESIGNIHSVSVEYSLNLSAQDMASGWRANRLISGGGAALDMGYHSIDLLTYIFGVPDKVYAQLSYNSLGDDYSIEDTMKAMMTYADGKINTNVTVTKISNQKSETVRIYGSEGSVLVDGRAVRLFDKDSNEVEAHSFNSKQHEVDGQLDEFVDAYLRKNSLDTKDQNFIDQLSNMRTIDAIYKSHASGKVVSLR